MPNDDYMQVKGTIIAAQGYGNFLVKIPELDDKTINCILSGRIKKNSIRVLEGDEVSVEVSIYDPTKGRITFRFKR